MIKLLIMLIQKRANMEKAKQLKLSSNQQNQIIMVMEVFST